MNLKYLQSEGNNYKNELKRAMTKDIETSIESLKRG